MAAVPMRVQTECNLTVRLRWHVDAGQNHPEFTYTCVQDLDMALKVATRAAENSPRGIRLTGVDVSPSGGRSHPWEPVTLEFAEDRSTGWLSGACA